MARTDVRIPMATSRASVCRRIARCLPALAMPVLTGCGSLGFNVVPLPEAECPGASVAALARFNGSSPLQGVWEMTGRAATASPGVMPFRELPPSASDIVRHFEGLKRQMPQRTQAFAEARAAVLPDLPKLVAAPERIATSAAAVERTAELWQALHDLSTAMSHQDRDVRRSIEARRPEPVQRLRIEVKADTADRLLRAMQAGADEGLQALTFSRSEESIRRAGEASRFARADPRDLGKAVLADAAASDLAEKLQEHEIARFLGAYAKAYFRNGRVFQAQLEVDPFVDEALKTIEAQAPLGDLHDKVHDALVQAMRKLCRAGSPQCLLSGALGDTAFITRSGDRIQFKGVSLSLGYEGHVQAGWDYPRSAEFAPQLVRVAVEAFFDADLAHRVPAVASATACTVSPPLYPAAYCIASSGTAAAPSLADVIESVDAIAGRADAYTTAALGQVTRGGWFLALNNEAVARSVENLGGVVARKLAERAAWQRAVDLGCHATTPNLMIEVTRR